MKKIPSLFKRDYEGNRQVYNEVVSGCEWVIKGEGTPTVKIDGTCCKVQDGVLYKRYDRKRHKKGKLKGQYKAAPDGWIAAEESPNEHTGHWPGWLPVGDGPEDKYHRKAFTGPLPNGTYELVGPKVQGNPYRLPVNCLVPHGMSVIKKNPRTFEDIKNYLETAGEEGIVWHHADGRMCKIKAKDFGIDWVIAYGA